MSENFIPIKHKYMAEFLNERRESCTADPQWMPKTTDSTEPYIYCVIKLNLEIRHSKKIRARTNKT